MRTAAELAQVLGVSVGYLRWLTRDRVVDTGTHYRHKRIRKRDGSVRLLTVPKRHLVEVQRGALKAVWERLPVHKAAHGFRKGRGIVTNARAHAGATVLVKLDVREFFPSVRARRVAGWLRVKGGASAEVAELLARLATEPPRRPKRRSSKITVYEACGPRALPQGAPTSPAVTNVLCGRMDRRLARLARRNGWTFTRYADDLTFSWAKDAERAPVEALLRLASAIVRAEGFRLNHRKTKVLRPGQRQSVTGLVVNAALGVAPVRVPRDVLRRLRAALHNRERGLPGEEPIEVLRGRIAFVCSVDREKGKALLDRLLKLERAGQC